MGFQRLNCVQPALDGFAARQRVQQTVLQIPPPHGGGGVVDDFEQAVVVYGVARHHVQGTDDVAAQVHPPGGLELVGCLQGIDDLLFLVVTADQQQHKRIPHPRAFQFKFLNGVGRGGEDLCQKLGVVVEFEKFLVKPLARGGQDLCVGGVGKVHILDGLLVPLGIALRWWVVKKDHSLGGLVLRQKRHALVHGCRWIHQGVAGLVEARMPRRQIDRRHPNDLAMASAELLFLGDVQHHHRLRVGFDVLQPYRRAVDPRHFPLDPGGRRGLVHHHHRVRILNEHL